MTTRQKKAQAATGSKPEVNHEVIAWALAGVLWARPDSRDASAIEREANKLGGATGDTTHSFRPEVMLRALLDSHTETEYEAEGYDRDKGTKAYKALVRLAGGPEGSPEPKNKKSCAWACWHMRRLRAALKPIPERVTAEQYEAAGKPRMEFGVLKSYVDAGTWREFNIELALQILAPLVAAWQDRVNK
jgi:hypothetical protein